MNLTIIEHDWKWRHALSRRKYTDAIVLHHAAAKTASAEDIHRMHLQRDNGTWAGIGYHLYIRKNGEVHRGRPIWASGAHTLNHNYHTVGVCVEGNYDVETVMPAAQLQALREALAYLKELYPSAAIKCHRDLQATACPGKWFPLGEALRYGQAPAPVSNPATNTYAKEIPDMETIRKGAKGYQVGIAQSILIHLGYLAATVNGVKQDDGIFGGKTYAAVVAYQKAKGLVADGIVGPKTWNKLLGVL